MKLPLNWLKDFVDTKEMSLGDLTDEISLKAFEVEDIEIVGKKIISPVVSAKIIDITGHPNADKLRIAQVIIKNSNNNEENSESLQIVCGAKNIEIGQIVPLALPGAIVINRQDGTELPIKKSKIRDVESNGMLCSAAELGIETSNPDGIHILSPDTPLGLDIVKILGLEPKIVLSIGSRSNRSDALCIQGIAREVSAAIGTELKTDYYKKDNYSKEAFISACEKLPKISCEIESKDLCTGALFLLFENIKIAESPSWMKEALVLSGIKTVNNIVDILNYVMLEIGQPMHAYDADKVTWQNGLQIRKAKENKNEKKFLGLDQNEYELSSEKSLLITDSEKLLSLAGIMGGLDSSITNDTKNILVEIACFNQATVRKSSRFSGISSESSRRFERGTEEELLYVAFNRVNELISQLITDARLTAFSETIIKSSQKEQILELSLKNYEKKIGLAISFDEAQNILEKLGFAVLHNEKEIIKVHIPSYRKKDITREIDLIEEVARFQGFNKIPLKSLPAMKDAPTKNNELENIKNTLKAQGYFESISSSFVTSEDLELSCSGQAKPIEMKNPISKENAFLRNALLPSMLKALKYNLNRQIESLKIFEVGKAYAQDENTQTHKLSDRETGTCEKELLGILCSSRIQKTDWKGKEKDIVDFFDLKGTLESLLNGKGKLTFSPVNSDSSVNTQLHTGASALVFLNGREIGFIGKIHPNLSLQKDLPENTFLTQIELEPLLKPRKFKFKNINNNPVMSRDFTIDIPREVFAIGLTNGQIETLIEKIKLENLLEYELTSFYDKSDSDKVSLSYRVKFQASGDNNLIGDRVNSSVEELKKKILSELPSVKIRS